jgi:hypothetical protein
MPLDESCDQCKAITRGGEVAYYICRNRKSRHFNKGVSIVTRNACQRKRRQPEGKTVDVEPPPTTRGIVRRAVSYAEALIEWTAAGKPKRSDKEVEQIFNQHCKPCRWYDPEKQICRGCGCRVADSGYVVLNKIKMATEHCPRKLW